ncbi:MAG: ABC transporter ATP-binding protein [Oscillospiraceae bacterium]|nr:ABC transporter ATP-binding protein [Oscillospiraceae bacterium]
MRFLLTYLKPFKKRMTVGLAIKIAGTVVELFLPYILTHILDNVIGTLRIEKVVFWGIMMIICAALACAGNIIANRMAAKTSKDFSKKMRKDLFAKTLYLSEAQTDAFTIPSLESRITTDTYNVHNFVSMMQRMGVRAPILLIGGMAISFFMDPSLALIMLATLPFIFITVYSISRNGIPLYAKVQEKVDGMVRVVREDTQGIRVIKALSKNDYENRRYDEVNLALSKEERKAGTIMGSVNPIMTLLMNLGITAVVAVSAFTVQKGISTPATVIAFVQYFTLISMAMMVISRIFVMYTKCAASAKRISEVLETPDSFFVTEDSSEGDSENFISFENVSFSYLGKKNNIDNLSVSVPKGGTLGIIGATGSGKSTFAKLLMRSYEADSGKIRIGGRDITSYSREELTSLFGVALQNDFLYADTIRENISFGRELSDEEIKRAAKIAQAEDFIEALPEKYEHVIAPKGTNLSGGQRQRLLIARAVAAKPDIIILDDSSSALDYKTDAALRKALDSELSDSTVITIAQRVSSVKNCGEILVLDNGKVIGRGTHEELLETCPEYKEISDSQMGGAFVD